jgi:hypothetical protein
MNPSILTHFELALKGRGFSRAASAEINDGFSR